jgi:hypothetical protein
MALAHWQGQICQTCMGYTCIHVCVSPQGVPLGLVDQHVWVRDHARWGQRYTAKERATKEKESQRWLTGAATAFATFPSSTYVVMIADREADIFDLFALPRRPGADPLVRAVQNRRVAHTAGTIWAAIR